MSNMLTQDEAELYDRQIRLWGVNAQSRLRQSKVLMLGFGGVASEIAKILTLAGVDTITIVDDKPLQSTDLTSNLFCRTENEFRTYQVEEKLRTLNPLVKINIDNTSILSKKSEDFKGYDLVTLNSFIPIEDIESINRFCRESKIKFYLVIDYGFFGFMFNDLGTDFKFTYEEYNKLADDQLMTQKQSGEEKDPINFDDDEDEDSADLSEDEDRLDSHRPKKRRRHHSPARREAELDKDRNEKMHKMGTLSYVTFEDMISFKGAKFDKKSSPVFPISIAMLKFFSEHKYLPRMKQTSPDDPDKDEISKEISAFNETISSLMDSLNLDQVVFDRFHPDWLTHITGSISPVCAVMGGVAGQDMIRALSNKDVPICNTFSFDGLGMSGVVERVGIEDSKSKIVSPVVRDYLEID